MEAESPCILVVDDDENIVYAITYLMESKGCRVLPALDPSSALAAIEDDEPAAAVIDIILPGMNGLKLAERVKSRWPRCEVVIITGQSSVETVVESIHQGAFDYLSKPFGSIEEVWAAVEQALARREESLVGSLRRTSRRC
jgi:DNA-binding NtrC family response regulator